MITSKPVHRVLVVAGSKQVYDFVSELLPSNEFDPIVHVPSASEAKRLLLSVDFDIVIINTPLPDEFGTEFAVDISNSAAGILLLCKAEIYEQVAYKIEDAGILTLPRPTSKQMFYSAVKLICAVAAKYAALEKKNKTLQEKMTDIRAVNRAKWLLIENFGMTEKEAHYHIEKQAMDSRISRREVAEGIIRTYDK